MQIWSLVYHTAAHCLWTQMLASFLIKLSCAFTAKCVLPELSIGYMTHGSRLERDGKQSYQRSMISSQTFFPWILVYSLDFLQRGCQFISLATLSTIFSSIRFQSSASRLRSCHCHLLLSHLTAQITKK